MSAKSRKRNRRLAALAGLAGAVAFANRKPKQSSTEADSGRGGDTASAKAREDSNKTTTTKKDTTVTTPKTIQDNKYKGSRNTKSIRVKENTNKVYTDATGGESTAKVGNKKSTFVGKDGYARTGENATPMTTGRYGTLKAASEMSKGALPPQLRKTKSPETYNEISPFAAKNGGRANYKSGGRAKGCGKALRGFGKAMKGNR